MGRYITGDIDHKFAFGVQPSDDADFFGVTGVQPSTLYYYFDEDNMEKINAGIERCLIELGEYKEKLDVFFEENPAYSDEQLKEYLGTERPVSVGELLQWYFRLELGMKIKDCVVANGACEFEAEC